MTSRSTMALGFATLERPQVVQRLIRSVRKYFPSLPIYVADQSLNVDAMKSFYASNDVTLVRMPYDIGVTASRNRLVHEAKEDYFILVDDDFIFGPNTSFEDAARILDAQPEIGVIGGRLFDLDGEIEWTRSWELYLEYNTRQKILFSIPIYELAPRVRETAGVRYYLCDAILNFALFRRSIFKSGVQWDERFKSNGEHEDFYLNMKVHTPFNVAYLPTMVAYHHHPEVYRAYRTRLRERSEGWRLFFEKWNIEQHIEFGLGVRTLDDLGTVTSQDDAKTRFFVNPNLSLKQSEISSGSILIGNFEVQESIGAFDKSGTATCQGRETGRLLINARTSAIIPLPSAGVAPTTRDVARLTSQEEIAGSYQLEPSGNGQAVSAAQEQCYFRYDPILRTDSDFFLWYLCSGDLKREKAANRLSVVIRWTASDGSILIWRSRRMYLDLRSGNFWQPLFVEVPVMPANGRWLRFDLVTDGAASANAVCTGFLFRRHQRTRHGDHLGDVLALGRLPNDGADRGTEGQTMAEVDRTCRRTKIALQDASHAPDLSLLTIEQSDELEVLYFVDWKSMGRTLVSARLPPAHPPMPRTIALPKEGWSSPDGRVYGFGVGSGLVALTQ